MASCYVLMAIFCFAAMIAAGSCDTELKLTASDDDAEWSEEFTEVAADVVDYLTRMGGLDYSVQGSSKLTKGVDCTGMECKFCVDTRVPKINQVCLELSLVPEEAAAVGQLTVNGNRIIKKKVSIKEKKVCIPIPSTPGKLCIALEDVNFDASAFRGCFKLSGKLGPVQLFSFRLGCMNTQLRGRSAKVQFSEAPFEEKAYSSKANYDKEF